jgi:mutator protein MutT
MAQQRARGQDRDGGRHHVVAAILHRGNRVLLCHRAPDRRWYPGVWDFPGGHVEEGERPAQALRRELAEEIGVDVGVVVDEPVLHLIDDETGFDLTVWHITSWTGTVRNRQPAEHDEVSWVAEPVLRHLDYADTSYLTVLLQILRAT